MIFLSLRAFRDHTETKKEVFVFVFIFVFFVKVRDDEQCSDQAGISAEEL